MGCSSCSLHLQSRALEGCGRGWQACRVSLIMPIRDLEMAYRPATTQPQLPPPQTMISTSSGTVILTSIRTLNFGDEDF